MTVLPDGRKLDVAVSGPADGPVLIYHHGTPGSLIAPVGMTTAAHTAGLRMVTYSRAGYGGSTRHPGRSVADVAADIAAVLDELGAERCVVAGKSGGGPHALATAALLPDRVAGVTSIAGVGPFDAEGLDFLAGMGEQNIEEFGLAVAGEVPLRAFMDGERPGLVTAVPADVVASMHTLLPAVDRAVLTEEVGQSLADSMVEGLRVGVDGWLDDDLAFTRPWGFELADVSVPTFLWQGSADLMVPFAHGQWLAEQLPNVTPHLIEGAGHFSIAVGSAEQMVAELLGTLA